MNRSFEYLLESPHWGDSNKYTKHMLLGFNAIFLHTVALTVTCWDKVLCHYNEIVVVSSVDIKRIECTFWLISCRQNPLLKRGILKKEIICPQSSIVFLLEYILFRRTAVGKGWGVRVCVCVWGEREGRDRGAKQFDSSENIFDLVWCLTAQSTLLHVRSYQAGQFT